MTPIGKGSRFLVLAGRLIGQEGTIVAPVRDCPGLWWLNVEGSEIVFEQSDADGPGFKRLPDAPAEVDPLFAEIAAYDIGERGSVSRKDNLDEIRRITFHPSAVDIDDEYWQVAHRAELVEIAALALAGIRAIDRR